jgi:hypothetical protein
MVDAQEKKPCGKCGEEYPGPALKYYRPLALWVCKTCYLILERRERAAREEAFRIIKEL